MDDARPASVEDQPARDPGARLPFDEEPAQRVPGSFLGALPQFFVFPLILVGTLLGVYFVLRLLAGADPTDARALVADIRSAPGEHARAQAVYTLAAGLARGTLDLADVPAAELADVYAVHAGTSPELRIALLQVLGHKRDPSLTAHGLAALSEEDADVRFAALLALALMADPASAPALRGHLETAASAEERLGTLGALANLRSPEALDVLAAHVQAEDTILARNAVVLLARAGDARASPWLGALLDPASYAGDPRLDDEALQGEQRRLARERTVDSFLIEACGAAVALGDPDLVPALRSLHEAGRSLKVTSAAIDALHHLGALPESR